jgi:hypothetical protein
MVWGPQPSSVGGLETTVGSERPIRRWDAHTIKLMT